MATLVGLLLMLFGVCPTPVSSAVETHCDGRQDGAQCYGAVGGAVVLQLMDSASDIFRFQLVFNTSQIILIVKENEISTNLLESRSIFTLSDGTFRINDLSRSDGGEYTLNMFDSQGKMSDSRTLQLFIQAPVSSVLLVHECLSQGEVKVFCDSEGGDSPEYSWTLDGRTLTEDKLLSGNNQNNTITLKQDVSGLLTCSVKNNVSLVSDKKQISTCGIDWDINGTHISKWVYAANNTLCIESTTQTTGTEMEPSYVAVEIHCDGRQDGAQCYGAVGGTLVLRLMDSVSDIYRFLLKFNTKIILNVKDNKIVSNQLESRSIFTPSDGTFRIDDLSRSDGGEYTLEMFNSKGQILTPQTLQLFIQAPVSSVLLVSECLSQGEVKASCLSEGGDSPEYSWTLDGLTLTDDKLLCGNHETNTIILKDDVSGVLVCSVRNHVSLVSDEKQISTCKGHSLLICGLLFVMATLSVGGIFLFFHLKKRKYEKTKVPVTPPAMDYENSSSVIELRG